MSRKVFYKYNPATDSFERVYPTRQQKMWAFARQALIGLAIGAALFGAMYYFVDTPTARELREENENLRDQYAALSRQADAALNVMADIAQRDNNMYRVFLQADPISEGQRYAGLEREIKNVGANALTEDALVASVTNKLNLLDKQIYTQSKSFDLLRQLAHEQQDKISHIPSIQPVEESKLRQVASGYGYRKDPIYGTTKFHEGMDFSAPIGTPIYATADGKVSFTGWQSGYGNTIEIDHGYNYMTRFAHLSKIDVKDGQMVKRGEKIGEMGNTGKSTGPHLHYEVRIKGEAQNPVNYYFYDLSPEEYDELIRLAENAGHVMD